MHYAFLQRFLSLTRTGSIYKAGERSATRPRLNTASGGRRRTIAETITRGVRGSAMDANNKWSIKTPCTAHFVPT
ncbi:hypothetical protein ANCDUO_02925 [Ancylostoma duodenale]|uniref:Uncharacterized protein n=1 Tax=Ancylostoma duodenale TaxID=51022 RepID=A0A0C2DV65_9BILA|nr:hypothetical protein ANCDUO_02925 [Ancylostoma duodenale]